MKNPLHPIRMQRSRCPKIKSIEPKRWTAYATAALSGGFTFSVAESALAEIHYSGLIRQEVPNGTFWYSYHYHTWGSNGGLLALPLRGNGRIELSHWKS